MSTVCLVGLASVVLWVVWYDVFGSAYLDGDTALGVGQGDGREGSEDDRETHFDGLEIRWITVRKYGERREIKSDLRKRLGVVGL